MSIAFDILLFLMLNALYLGSSSPCCVDAAKKGHLICWKVPEIKIINFPV